MPPRCLEQSKGVCSAQWYLGIAAIGLDDPSVRITAYCAKPYTRALSSLAAFGLGRLAPWESTVMNPSVRRIEYAPADPWNDPATLRLADGSLEAVFLPSRGMLGASLRHRGAELLRRVEDLAAAAARGSSAGIPLLHPWANRLAGAVYEAAGRKVTLDLSSRLLHLDSQRLPMHGVGWPLLTWDVHEATPERIVAQLEWNSPDLLAVFPFRHHLEMTVTLRSESLTVETTLVAGPDGPVPVSFGFHPYFGIPGLPRAQWRLTLPAMRRLVSDERGIPSGASEPFGAFDSPLAATHFDDGFVVQDECPAFSIAGGGRRITVRFLAGYRYVQVFAPRDQEYIAIEPMTARTNALASGRGLQLVQPGRRFRAAFEVVVGSITQ
jgi:aldose 1-epimerase